MPSLYAIIDAAGLAHGKGMKSYLIMMAVRLMEMQRLLRGNGSIFLHCDPTASHYLKSLLDTVFGHGNFRSEITWRRTNAKGLSFRGYPNNADTILYYSKGQDFTWNRPLSPSRSRLREQVFTGMWSRELDGATGWTTWQTPTRTDPISLMSFWV